MSVPRAGEGELSFGLGRHHDQWLGDSTAASTAAGSLAGRDWIWRVSDGAKQLEVCRTERGIPQCRLASFGTDPPDGRLALVDPRTLGEDAEGSSLEREPGVLRAHAGGGVWLRGGSSVVGLYYCRVDRLGPGCRAVRFDDAPFRPSQLIGVFALAGDDSASDVIWAVRADREIVRCAAVVAVEGDAPSSEPRCVAARSVRRPSEGGGETR